MNWPEVFPPSYLSVNLFEGGPILKKTPLPKYDQEKCIMVVKPILVGICRSDIKEITNERAIRNDFGHEIMGRFIWANVPIDLDVNSLVCFDPHVMIDRTSGFSEYLFAFGSQENLLSAFPKCPTTLEEHRAVFVEPLACAYHAIARLKSSLHVEFFKELNIGILGAGNSGTLIGLIAKHLGANVKMFNRNIKRLEYLAENNLFTEDELVIQTTKVSPLDGIVLATTFLDQNTFYWGMDNLKSGGVLLLFGGTRPYNNLIDQTLDLDDLRRNQKEFAYTYKKKTVLIAGTYGVKPTDIQASFHLLGLRDAFPVERLILNYVTLSDLCELLKEFAAGEKPYIGKLLVRI